MNKIQWVFLFINGGKIVVRLSKLFWHFALFVVQFEEVKESLSLVYESCHSGQHVLESLPFMNIL